MIDRRNAITSMTAIALSLCGIKLAYAHHGFAFEFDVERQGTVVGMVTEVRYTNPHVVYMLDVEAEDDTAEEWLVRTHNVRVMNRLGWNPDTIQVGDQIEATGSLGRGGTNKISLDSVVLADGSVRVPRGGEYSDAYTTDEVNASANSDYGAQANDYEIDITGAWTNRYRFQLTVDDFQPKPTPFTPEGRALYTATENWQDPAKSCKDSGLPRWFGGPFSMEIVDAGTHYLMASSSGLRRVWMNDRQPPAELLPGSMGFSVGHWEDNVLVIETSHLMALWLDGSGLPMSGESTRIVETWTVSDNGLTIDRQMTIHDPRYYTEPLVRTRGSSRQDGLELAEGSQGCDPTSYLQDLFREGRIETLWQN
ncbi:MAG: DUF6152 family protein [Gammaproteobacteria bacterium]